MICFTVCADVYHVVTRAHMGWYSTMTICSNLNVIFCKLPTQLVWRYFPILVVCAKRPQMYGNSCSFPHNAYDSYTSLVIQMKGVFCNSAQQQWLWKSAQLAWWPSILARGIWEQRRTLWRFQVSYFLRTVLTTWTNMKLPAHCWGN